MILQKILDDEGETIFQLQIKINQSMEPVHLLNERMINAEKDEHNSFIRADRRFGGTGGFPFDDSLMKNPTCSYYLRGMITQQSSLPMECIEFLYSSSHHPNEIIKADLLGIPGKDDIDEQILLNGDQKNH
ncbi:unnamed protein product [Rotaria sp. Silwood1]|nr:unnamed protein product [Rotaria sp. Silwood1]CAF4078356.1 unnamed protein product [Rotaria sp. Silwood1]CAF4914925.1 unnamed protein product [Rotaria sp. Silwood1]